MIPIVVIAIGCAAVLFLALVLVRRLERIKTRARRIQVEDALKHTFHGEERGTYSTLESLAGIVGNSPVQVTDLVRRLSDEHLVLMEGNVFRLTAEGKAEALRIIRSHRIWERYLADETGVSEEQWHPEADKREHRMTSDEVEQLAKKLGHPLYDPHGDPIPSAQGAMPTLRGTSLQQATPGHEYQIVHLEDEPTTVYHDLLEAGLFPGAVVSVVERTDRNVRVSLGDAVHTFPAVEAANVTVVPHRGRRRQSQLTLDKVPLGKRAKVLGISDQCRGVQRRRLLDLGVVPGSVIGAELMSSGGDPVAYRIRGSLVALRKAQAAMINVEKIQEGKR